MILVIKLFILFINILYVFFKIIPSQRKITMLSRQSNYPSKDFLMIEERIKAIDHNIKVVKLCRTLDGGINSSLLSKIKYGFHTLLQMYHIATSKVVVLDSYCIVVSVLRHKKNLKIIQIWHSMGTMKKFGYAALDTEEGTKSEIAYVMKMHNNYDYVFASADSYKEHLANGFHIDKDKIITMPLPRLDLLKSQRYKEKTQSLVYKAYPMLKEKPVIMYCPTFRKNEMEFEKALERLIKCIDFDKYNFVVKLHPLSKVILKEDIIQAKEFSSFDMLFVADYVISDYSCIIYEAAVLNIPLYFYNFDMNLYLKERGLAIDYYKELPGVISKNPEEIFESIEDKPYDMNALQRFKEKYIFETENATENIAKFILNLI